jgi:D-methionine transport system substrate-binding protein
MISVHPFNNNIGDYKMKKVIKVLTTALLAIFTVVGVQAQSGKTLTFGFVPGPYVDLFKLGIKPGLVKKGYKIEIKEFTDWVTPNIALANNEINVNIFQHSRYLKKFSEDKGLKLSGVITIPTASFEIYSKKLKARNPEQLKKELKPGNVVTIPNDPTNLARALVFLRNTGLITIKAKIDATKASEKDIDKNPYGLVFKPVEAAQLPRTLESVTFSVISGNYAIAAGLKLSSGIARERLNQDIIITIAVRSEDLNKQFIKDIISVVQSSDFKAVVENPTYVFHQFERPEWYVRKWGIKNR